MAARGPGLAAASNPEVKTRINNHNFPTQAADVCHQVPAPQREDKRFPLVMLHKTDITAVASPPIFWPGDYSLLDDRAQFSFFNIEGFGVSNKDGPQCKTSYPCSCWWPEGQS
jgi:hypothetical protein